jgi:3-deoxy-D-manno-octulosonate 8-phosphate phosphatase (KDO 8-P phosphatase)
LDDIDLLFSGSGGKFCTPVKELKLKLSKTRAIIFDWDGVFNNGSKSDSSGSPFSEPDSMGVNLLRLSFWLAHRRMPPTAILSGEENKAGLYLAKREHFSSVYFKSTNKIKSLHHFMKEHGLAPEEIIFVFDDVLDLSLAEVCGVRIQVNRPASVLFNQWVALHHFADYVTASEGGNFAVREACELLMGLNGSFDTALRERMTFGSPYQQYLVDRQAVETRLFTAADGEVKGVVNR